MQIILETLYQKLIKTLIVKRQYQVAGLISIYSEF